MADLKDKIVLVTGAAGAIGAAVVAAVKRAGGTAIATDLAARRHRRSARCHRRGRLATRRRRDRAQAWPARRAGERRRHRRGRQRRADSTSPPGGACSASISTAPFSAANIRFRCCAKRAARSSTCRRCRAWSAAHNLAAYNASKGGLSLLTKSVALYGARYKPPVRCNAVCPAFVEGPMVDAIAQGARDPQRGESRN